MRRLRHFSIIFFPFLAAILIVSSLIYKGEVDAERLSLEIKSRYIVDMATESIQEDIGTVGDDLSYLVEDYERYVNSGRTREEADKSISRECVRFAEKRKMYSQIRILGESGNEIVKVKYSGGEPRLISDRDLVSKADGEYKKESTGLKKEEMFISPIEARKNNGRIEYPLMPVIRFISPLFSSTGKKDGMVELNYSGRYLLNKIRKIKNKSYEATGLPGHLMITNKDSYWIMSDDPQDEWDYVSGEKDEDTFQKVYPGIWKTISGTKSSDLNVKDGIFVFDTITLSAGEEGGNRWKIVFFITSENIKILLFSKWVYFLALTGFFSCILFVVSLFLANSNVKREEAEKEMEKMARTDPLTFLYNRRSFLEKFEYERARSERYGGAISVVLCDIDFFKKINDEYGHDAGDYVLKTVAGILRGKVRKQDTVCRWGGEEFIIIFPETTVEKAAVGVERLRKVIEEYAFRYEDDQIKVTMSFGLAQHSLDLTIDECIKKADELLYLSKERGRNMISFSNM